MKMDYTSILRKAINALFLSHTVRTSLGVALGAGIHGTVQLFSPFLKRYSGVIDISSLGWIHSIIFGVLIMHAQTIYYLFRRKSTQDEKIDNILQLIEDSEKLGVPEWQRKHLYTLAIKKVLEDLELNEDLNNQLKKLENKATQTEAESSS